MVCLTTWKPRNIKGKRGKQKRRLLVSLPGDGLRASGEGMAAELTFKYGRAADILHIDKRS